MSSFDRFFQQLMGRAAQQGSNVIVYAPVTVNIGNQPPSDPALIKLIELSSVGGSRAWDEAEREHYTPKGDVPNDEKFETDKAADKLERAMAKTNFRGTVDQQTLIDKAVKLGFREDAGVRLWNLLNTSAGLRKLCDDYNMDFPLLGKNGKFRRVDLRELASLGNITGVVGFGSRSQTLKVLRAL